MSVLQYSQALYEYRGNKSNVETGEMYGET